MCVISLEPVPDACWLAASSLQWVRDLAWSSSRCMLNCSVETSMGAWSRLHQSQCTLRTCGVDFAEGAWSPVCQLNSVTADGSFRCYLQKVRDLTSFKSSQMKCVYIAGCEILPINIFAFSFSYHSLITEGPRLPFVYTIILLNLDLIVPMCANFYSQIVRFFALEHLSNSLIALIKIVCLPFCACGSTHAVIHIFIFSESMFWSIKIEQHISCNLTFLCFSVGTPSNSSNIPVNLNILLPFPSSLAR